jgi:hypothetical protein
MERSEIRRGNQKIPGLRGACHWAALCADPLAPFGLRIFLTSPACAGEPALGLDPSVAALDRARLAGRENAKLYQRHCE